MQKLSQIASRMRAFAFGNFFGRAHRYDRTAAVAPLGTEIDDMIRRFDNVKIMLDHKHGIAVLTKTVQNGEQLFHVCRMQSRCRLVKDIDGLARTALGKLCGKLDALCFTARKRS